MPSPSYVCGTSDTPLLGYTIGAYLDEARRRFGRSDALVSLEQGIRISWSELIQAADQAARGLMALGIASGDRLGVWSPNRYEWIVLQLAAARIGAILVTVNPAYRTSEVEYALKKVQCKGLVVSREFKTSNYYQMLEGLWNSPQSRAHLTDLAFIVGLDDPVPPNWCSWGELHAMANQVAEAQLRAAIEATEFDDAINIQFTSGTTGAPKGATLSHHNLLNNGRFVGDKLRLSESDRLCLVVPLYHCFGLVQGVLAALTHGSALVLPGMGFDASKTLDAIEKERCTTLYGVPTMFVAMLEAQQASPRDLNSLRTGIMAGSPCPIEVMRAVIDRLHLPEITICYGMTETSPVSFQSDVDDSIERRVGTVGRVHPHVEVKIVDERGRIVPRGQKGELLTRGYSVMRGGYWQDAARTREAIDASGWMHTGDLATIDEDGYCNIVGRIKDMVIRGGENIYPREVEELIHSHEAVADVQVFGVPSDKFGEELCAWIKLRSGHILSAEALVDWARSRISHYKVPRYVEFVDTFPLTASGKAQKYLMRQEMTRRLGLSESQTA